MVFYGRHETSRKAHFLFSAPANDPSTAMQQLLLLTTRLIKEQALKNFYPSQELLYVAEPEGGYMKQTTRRHEKVDSEVNRCDNNGGDGLQDEAKPHPCCTGDDLEDRAFWWSSTHACNPEFHRNLAKIEREIEALGEDYFSDTGDSGRLERTKWDRIEQSAAAAAVW
jgi:hypothetical protein